MGTGTDSMLMEIHSELAAKLEKVVRKPLFITVTYKDQTSGRLEHFQCQNNDFADSDIVKTLNHLLSEMEKKLQPNPVIANLHQQFRARSRKASRGLRS